MKIKSVFYWDCNCVIPLCVCVQSGLTPLHLVAQEGHVGISDMLVKQGASVYAASRVRAHIYCPRIYTHYTSERMTLKVTNSALNKECLVI